jgi:cytochrome c biogenesis protein CcdA/peroxiredoxin
MTLLILFAFLGGIITILSPCILPILPIVLSSGITGGKRKPFGVVTGFILSFTFFTLFLASLVRATGLSADGLRTLAAVVILLFGLVLVIPQLNNWWELVSGRLMSRKKVNTQKDGYTGGLIIGLSVGLLWAPCVGPIMAAIITLAATGNISATLIPIVLAYALGTALPMLAIIWGSRSLIDRFPLLRSRLSTIQRFFGLLMILTAMAIYLNLDRRFQAWVLDQFPGYGTGLTQLEDNPMIDKQLQQLTEPQEGSTGRPSDTLMMQAPEITGGTHWVNSDPLTIEGLRGKVVLIDFWTYSCINCIRTLPYLTAWHEKYQDKGLVIIGVHSPEFEFEKETGNVAAAMKDFSINYPVVQDNDFIIWRAYRNRYWPAKYLIDKNGSIRYTHFGEGKYAETEAKIQDLLGEKQDLVSLKEFTPQTRTPEIYLGSLRSTLENRIYFLENNWEQSEEYIKGKTGSRLTLNFDAKQVNLVAKPSEGPVTLKLTLDGLLLEPVVIDADKLYPLVSLEEPGSHELIIELDNEGQLFAFTFG